jgi:hypothetical protein
MAEKWRASGNLVCSFCGKTQDQVRKLIAGPTVFICDECVDLCNDIILEETEMPDDEGSPPIARTSRHVVQPDIITRYANSDVDADSTKELNGCHWVCDECGWSLRLKPGAAPPSEHSEEVHLGKWPGPLRSLSDHELVPPCPKPSWRRLG